jgi:hypothetical protein
MRRRGPALRSQDPNLVFFLREPFAHQLLQCAFGKFPAAGFQVLDNRFSDFEPTFLDHTLPEAGNFHLF